jgi:hypothetical protein
MGKKTERRKGRKIMKSYNTKGLYNSYDKKHKERDALDYYSTPITEVNNILNQLNLDFKNKIILEPCCGGRSYVSRYPELYNSTPR